MQALAGAVFGIVINRGDLDPLRGAGDSHPLLRRLRLCNGFGIEAGVVTVRAGQAVCQRLMGSVGICQRRNGEGIRLAGRHDFRQIQRRVAAGNKEALEQGPAAVGDCVQIQLIFLPGGHRPGVPEGDGGRPVDGFLGRFVFADLHLLPLDAGDGLHAVIGILHAHRDILRPFQRHVGGLPISLCGHGGVVIPFLHSCELRGQVVGQLAAACCAGNAGEVRRVAEHQLVVTQFSIGDIFRHESGTGGIGCRKIIEIARIGCCGDGRVQLRQLRAQCRICISTFDKLRVVHQPQLFLRVICGVEVLELLLCERYPCFVRTPQGNGVAGSAAYRRPLQHAGGPGALLAAVGGVGITLESCILRCGGRIARSCRGQTLPFQYGIAAVGAAHGLPFFTQQGQGVGTQCAAAHSFRAGCSGTAGQIAAADDIVAGLRVGGNGAGLGVIHAESGSGVVAAGDAAVGRAAQNTGGVASGGDRPHVVAVGDGDGPVLFTAHDAAGAAVCVLIGCYRAAVIAGCNGHIGSGEAHDAADIVRTGDGGGTAAVPDRAGGGHRLGQNTRGIGTADGSGDNDILDSRTATRAEQAGVGRTSDLQAGDSMTRTVKNPGEGVLRLANGRPVLIFQVNICGQYSAVILARVDLIAEPCQLRAGADLIDTVGVRFRCSARQLNKDLCAVAFCTDRQCSGHLVIALGSDGIGILPVRQLIGGAGCRRDRAILPCDGHGGLSVSRGHAEDDGTLLRFGQLYIDGPGRRDGKAFVELGNVAKGGGGVAVFAIGEFSGIGGHLTRGDTAGQRLAIHCYLGVRRENRQCHRAGGQLIRENGIAVVDVLARNVLDILVEGIAQRGSERLQIGIALGDSVAIGTCTFKEVKILHYGAVFVVNAPDDSGGSTAACDRAGRIAAGYSVFIRSRIRIQIADNAAGLACVVTGFYIAAIIAVFNGGNTGHLPHNTADAVVSGNIRFVDTLSDNAAAGEIAHNTGGIVFACYCSVNHQIFDRTAADITEQALIVLCAGTDIQPADGITLTVKGAPIGRAAFPDGRPAALQRDIGRQLGVPRPAGTAVYLIAEPRQIVCAAELVAAVNQCRLFRHGDRDGL